MYLHLLPGMTKIMCLHKPSWENESNLNNLLLAVYKANGHFRHFFFFLQSSLQNYEIMTARGCNSGQDGPINECCLHYFEYFVSPKQTIYAHEIPLNVSALSSHIDGMFSSAPLMVSKWLSCRPCRHVFHVLFVLRFKG